VFGVDSSELLIVAIAALIFIGPKDLPGVMRSVGRWVGKLRGMARHFTIGIETMMREAELEEMDRKWREENERIMRDYPSDGVYPEPDPAQVMLPLEPPASGDAETPPAKRPLP
jgi:sec-independent protein translocase protein TatB